MFAYRMIYPANKTGRIWHCRVPASAAAEARFYAYTIEGPFEPAVGHRFDPKKVLLDPYAKAVFFPKDFSRHAAVQSGSNGGHAPLGVLPPDGTFDWSADRRNNPFNWRSSFIDPAHVADCELICWAAAVRRSDPCFQESVRKVPCARMSTVAATGRLKRVS